MEEEEEEEEGRGSELLKSLNEHNYVQAGAAH